MDLPPADADCPGSDRADEPDPHMRVQSQLVRSGLDAGMLDCAMTLTNSGEEIEPLTPTIFHEKWYLEAASAGRYKEALVTHKGKLVGRFPYVITRLSFGRTLCEMPQLTHFLGPAVDEGDGATANRSLRRDKIIRELLSSMPRTTGFSHKMHAGLSDTLVFQEMGCSASVQFTYELAPATERELWLRMRDKTRNAIRGAEKQLRVRSETTPDTFCRFYRKNIAGSELVFSYDQSTLIDVCRQVLARGRGKILSAHRSDGTLTAAILYVWDATTSYYLLTTRAADSGSGAVSLLVWEAIKDSAARGLLFDFDGVATSGSRLFFSGFAGKIVPRFIAFRFSTLHRATDKILLGLKGTSADAGRA